MSKTNKTKNDMNNATIVPIIIEALHEATKRLDAASYKTFAVMLKKAQHGHQAYQADFDSCQAYLTKETI